MRSRRTILHAALVVAAMCFVAHFGGCGPAKPLASSSAAAQPDEIAPAEHVAAVDRQAPKADPSSSVEAVSSDASDDAPSTRETLAKAIDFLMRQQSDDGAFKSTTYGPLKHGPAMTSLALYAMSHAPKELIEPQRETLQQAYDFLRPGLEKRGQIAAPDGTLDYPTYDAALILIAARRLKLAVTEGERKQLEQWLIDMQLTEKHGIQPDSIHYGGWDLEAASGASGDQLKGSNIALTALCLEALSESMHADASAAVSRAKKWVLGAQNPDGGFVFHPWRPHPGNKAMWEDDNVQSKAYSYGTPTCDGLRSLMYVGFNNDDKPAAAAAQWLVDHPDVKHVPGLEAKAKDTGWREGLRFYYYYSQAKALPMLPEKEAARRRHELQRILIAEQKRDGRYQNEQPRMFEDDPLLATGLAIVALAESLP